MGLVGPESSFVNVYGVWVDEFASLGLEDCLERVWPDTACYFASDDPVRMGRPYGKVDRAKLRAELIRRCAAAGKGAVRYRGTELVEARPDSGAADDDGPASAAKLAGLEGLGLAASSSSAGGGSTLRCRDGSRLRARLVVIASGAASGAFIEHEPTSLQVGAQTAYGVMCEVKPGTYPFSLDLMHFMDFRRHHT